MLTLHKVKGEKRACPASPHRLGQGRGLDWTLGSWFLLAACCAPPRKRNGASQQFLEITFRFSISPQISL